jgi:hypothetical protein
MSCLQLDLSSRASKALSFLSFSFVCAHAPRPLSFSLDHKKPKPKKTKSTVLAGYDQVQLILFGKKYGSGEG